MESSGDFSSPPELDYEGWRGLIRSLCGRYNPEGIEPKAFAGWVRPVTAASLHADVRPLDHPPLHDGSPRPGPPDIRKGDRLIARVGGQKSATRPANTRAPFASALDTTQGLRHE
jgi:hypothetical protein